MGAPIVYRFDDDGAPALSGIDNTRLISVLKACLVDGYGSKPGAGWTMPYINGDGDTASFRNNPATGTGFYLNVRKSSYKYDMWVAGYESMIDENTGSLPFCPDTTALRIRCSNTADSTARPWVLIADDRLFYFVSFFTSTYANLGTNYGYMAVLVFGDAIPWIESDNYFCVLFATAENSGYLQADGISSSGPGSNFYNNAQNVARNVAGDINDNTRCHIVFGGGPCSDGAHGRRNPTYGMDRVLGSEIMSRPYIDQGAIYTMRGYLPGLWTPCHKVRDFNVLEQLDIGTHRFIVFPANPTSSNDGYLFAIDISEHWRP